MLFDDPVDVGNLISGSSAFSKTSLNIWKFTVHILLKPGLDDFEYYCITLLACEMPGWMKHKLKSRLPEEISITSDMRMTPPFWQKAKN